MGKMVNLWKKIFVRELQILGQFPEISGHVISKKKKREESGHKRGETEQFELSDIIKILRTQTRKKHTSFNE